MPTKERQLRTRPRGKACWADRTDEILDAAAVVFAQHGYQHTEMQLIADALKIAKGTLYLYFPSKEDLFLKAVARGMQRLSQSVRDTTADISDPIDRIAKAIHTYLLFFRTHPHYTELLIQERAQFRDTKQATYFAHCDNVADRWRALYADLISAGIVRDIPVDRILGVINDLLYGTMLSNYFSGRHKLLEVQAEDLVDIFFRGILSDARRQRSAEETLDVPPGSASPTPNPKNQRRGSRATSK